MSTWKRYACFCTFSFTLHNPFSSRYRRVSCPAALDIPATYGPETILILIQSYRHLTQIHAHKCVCKHEMNRLRPCRGSTLQLQKEDCRQARMLVHTNEGERSYMVIYIIVGLSGSMIPRGLIAHGVNVIGHSSATPAALPIPAQRAETEEERDDAIIKWIKPQVENHPEFLQYMQSKAKLQRVSEVLKQYEIISHMLEQLSGLTTPVDWDGAPGCVVKMVRLDLGPI